LRISDCGLRGQTVRRGAASSPPPAVGRAVARRGESSTFDSPLDVGSRSLSLFNSQFEIRNPQFLHPFIPVVEMPWMKVFCARKNRTMIGTVKMVAAAMSFDHSPPYAPRNCWSPYASVYFVWSFR